MRNFLVAQSGGPTSAINSTLVGVLKRAMSDNKIDNVYGAIGGICGLINGEFFDFSKNIKENDFMLLTQTPAAALGSCRLKLDEPEDNPEQFEDIVKKLRAKDINHFVYIGGNDSMDTVNKLSRYLKSQNIDDITVVGAPKTIDNDLIHTDHCPGFGSAAKYIATTIAELERDCSVYDVESTTIVEIMGRDAGWLTAASALSRLAGGRGPSLIYFCERVFDREKFLQDVRNQISNRRNVLIAVSEGMRTADGKCLSEALGLSETDAFGHKQNAGAGRVLEDIVKTEIGCKTRSIELNLMQRASSHIASATDIYEARKVGEKAADCAIKGEGGVMANIVRLDTPDYAVKYSSFPVCEIANHVRSLPDHLINSAGTDVTEEAIKLLAPLIKGEIEAKYENGLPVHKRLF